VTLKDKTTTVTVGVLMLILKLVEGKTVAGNYVVKLDQLTPTP
jgi:hypothetical protein